jgi:phosphoglycolate phosphatase-like HAD superfamily hydrolase
MRVEGPIMRYPVKAAFFDVDGVLLDSLPQHLKFCQDKAAQFGFSIEVPTMATFRQMVARGVKVSPMRNFFLAVGFPQDKGTLERAVTDYERDFMKLYRPSPFPNVESMLHLLSGGGQTLGLVTSNTRENVVPALGAAMKYFNESCLFFYDRHAEPKPKSRDLMQGAKIAAASTRSCVYIGDQPADAQAADEAGLQFLGVTFGWGIVEGDVRFETVDSIRDIPDKLLGTAR